MRNRDIIKQYVNSCFDLPENQYNKLTTSLKKTYKRTVLKFYKSGNDYPNFWQFELFDYNEQLNMIRDVDNFYSLNFYCYEYFDDNFKCEYLLTAIKYYMKSLWDAGLAFGFVINNDIVKKFNTEQRKIYNELEKESEFKQTRFEVKYYRYNWYGGTFLET